MADYTPTSYTVRNSLIYAYRALKSKPRLLKNSTISPYENFYNNLAQSLSPQKKLDYTIPNSEVESFYVGRLSEANFIKYIETRVCSKIMIDSPGGGVTSPTGGVAGLVDSTAMLFSIIWDLYSSSGNMLAICSKVHRTCGQQLWEMFLILDVACQMEVELDDIADLIQRIFITNSRSEELETIKSWFGNESGVDFFTFFQTMSESYSHLLTEAPLQNVYNFVCLELIHQGRLMKKGHVVHNWKWRWFILSATALRYYESQESMILKGAITINCNSQVQAMQESRGHPYKFRVLDGLKNVGYEISAPTEKAMREWMYQIKLAIQTHVVVGRNLLHRYRLAEANMPKPTKWVVAVDANSHRPLSPSKSVPIDSTAPKSSDNKRRPLPLPPTPDGSRQQAPTPPLRVSGGTSPSNDDRGLLDSVGDEAPPIPPQRLNSEDIRDLKPHPLMRRHSSDAADDVKHIQVGNEDYAIVNKDQPRKKKTSAPERTNERLLLLETKAKSNKKNKPLPMPRSNNPREDDTTQQHHSIQILEDDSSTRSRSPKPKDPSGGYIKLSFQREGEDRVAKPKQTNGSVMAEEAKPRDVGRTKFDYSTIVFGAPDKKDKDLKMAGKLKKDKGPPPPVEKYNPAKKMNRYKSDTQVLNEPDMAGQMSKPSSLPDLLEGDKKKLDYAQVDFSDLPPPPPPHGRSKSPHGGLNYSDVVFTPSLPMTSSSGNGGGQDQPYVNVPPRIAPRKGVASPNQDSPPVPSRKHV